MNIWLKAGSGIWGLANIFLMNISYCGQDELTCVGDFAGVRTNLLLMKKNFATRVLLLGLLAACNPEKEEEKTPSIQNKIVIKGSETELEMVTRLKEAFLAEPGDVSIELSGGGSEEGIRLLINNSIDIANASRKMSSDEVDQARKHHVEPVPIIFAVDVMAIITHPKLGVDSLSLHELEQIYSGKATNWKQFHGPDAPIRLYGRDLKSGTHHYFKHKVLQGDYAPGMSQHKNYEEIIEKVENDPYGIGYVSLGHLLKGGKPNQHTWAVYLYIEGSAACSPYEARWVNEGQYPLIRPLYQYTNGVPANEVKRFIDFELSPRGQGIISLTGFYPINDFHRQINRKAGYQ